MHGSRILTFMSGLLVIYLIYFTRAEPENLPPSSVEQNQEPIKLTMRQGLLMNQVLATYALSDLVPDGLCFKHTQQFKAGLRAFEPWALQMFDSSSKIQAGILMGNLMEYGAFKQCLDVFKAAPAGAAIQGKFCTLHIYPDDKLLKTILSFRNITEKQFQHFRTNVLEVVKMRWSVCLPASCTARQVLHHFNKTIMELVQGLELSVELTEKNCVSLKDLPSLTSTQLTFLSILITIVLIVITATLLDYFTKKETEPSRFVDVFSAYSNGRRIFAKGLVGSELDCLHGLRFLSVCYVVFGHRYMEIMQFPTVNSLAMTSWISTLPSGLIMAGTVSVDTFFVISAILLSYSFFHLVTKTNKFNIVHFYVMRYLRIALPTSVCVIVFACFIQFFGSGPLWNDTYKALQRPCQKYWWTSLLFIQNYVNYDQICIIQTWYLSSSMLYFYASPLIIYPLWKKPTLGIVICFLSYCVAILSSFYLAWTNRYPGGMPTTATLLQTKYFQKFYIQPHTRVGPYIMGLAFGYFAFQTKDRKIELKLPVRIIGWLVTIVCMISPIVGELTFVNGTHVYHRFESSIFLACSRSGWSVGILWMIWCCVNGYGGFLNTFLSWHVFRVLGRIGFGIFMFHILFQFLKGGAAKTPEYFSNFITMYAATADLLFMIMLGFCFSLCFEYPVIQLQAIVVKKISKDKVGKIKPKA